MASENNGRHKCRPYDRYHMQNKGIIITDVGSTTTKALLIAKTQDKYQIIDYETSPTTVEKPNENVTIGIINSIKKIEEKQNINILDTSQTKLKISDQYLYLSTSSAGGGLQILVIGLTTVDSAYFATKAVYGAGGIVLNILASDDKRTTTERLFTLNNSHPDIILFTGGFDGGALFGVYRLAEILKCSSISQKFTFNPKLPVVFAGNKEAQDFLSLILMDKCEVFMMPNIRPQDKVINIKPTQDKIQEIFMDHVMEYAPGYSEVKEIVCEHILPTPASVLKTMKILGTQHNTMILFDMGGATTDIFTNIYGQFFRSVSANYGMSYSIGNILSDTDLHSEIQPYINAYNALLPENQNPLTMSYLQNYVGNKIIYPTSNPINDIDKYIEHIIAIQGIKKSFEQHINIHFAKKRSILLESLMIEGWFEERFYPHKQERLVFKMSDIKILIGSGGVISNATKEQALFMMIESFRPSDIVELWRDKRFISPHLGVLSNIDESVAKELIFHDCYEKLALYIKPKKKRINIQIDEELVYISSNDFFYREISQTVNLKVSGKVILLEKDMTLIVDTRDFSNKELSIKTMLPFVGTALMPSVQKYMNSMTDGINAAPTNRSISINAKGNCNMPSAPSLPAPKSAPHELTLSLLYSGDVYVKPGDTIKPDTILGGNKDELPRFYIILISEILGRSFTEEEIKEGLKINKSDTISVNDVIFINKDSKFKTPENQRKLYEFRIRYSESRNPMVAAVDTTGIIFQPDDVVLSPVNGIVDTISYSTGTILIKEYASSHGQNTYQLLSQVYGSVISVTDNKDITVNINAIQIDGKIGFGKNIGGVCKCYASDTSLTGNIIYINRLTYTDVEYFITQGVKGVICDFISYYCLKQLLGKDIGVAITGNEELPFSLLILNGFSDSVSHDCTTDFSLYEDKYVLLLPATQIRAGVVRPRVLVFE